MFHHGGILQRLIKICAAWDRINLSLPNRRLKSGPRTRHEIKIKKRRINKNRFFGTPSEIRDLRFGLDRPRWLINRFFYRRVDHDEWYIDRLNHPLIELFKAKIAKIEAWRLKMVSNWWLLNFQNFEISKRSKKTERSE